MRAHSARQRELLRKIGVGVWRLRDGAADDGGDGGDGDGGGGDDAPPRRHSRMDAGNPVATDGDLQSGATPEGKRDSRLKTAGITVGGGGGESHESLETIQREVAACRKCELHASRTNTVFGAGAPRAQWLFVGEAPGRNEDLQGVPFVGAAGRLLERMIAALGMRRDQVFIANVLKCRPPGNRDPRADEVAQCEPYLHRQLALIQPKVIVALGRISAQALLKSDDPLGRLRGRVHRYRHGDRGDDIALVATYHPAYLLRSPAQKAKAWEDLLRARAVVADDGDKAA